MDKDMMKSEKFGATATTLFLENGNGEESGVKKVPKARILFSARLTLALLCLFATWNSMFQRLTINFGLVCMVRSPHLDEILESHNESFSASGILMEDSGGIVDDNNNASELIEDTLDQGWFSGRNNCPLHIPKNQTGKFDDGIFDWSKDTQGLILAAFYYGFVIAQIPGGWFSDRYGAKRGLIWSGLLLSLTMLLIPVASHLGPMYLVGLRLLGGAVNGAAMPAISSLSSRWFADIERGSMLGIVYAGFGVATAMTYPISAFFCEFLGWDYLFYFAGSIGVLWAVMAQFLVFDWPEVHPRISEHEKQYIQKHRAVQYGGPARQKLKIPWKSMLLSLPVWSLMIANFCCFWLFLTVSMYLPTYLKEVLHLDISENGMLSSLPFILMMTSHFVVAVIFDKIRKRKACSVTSLRKIFNTSGTLISALCIALVGFLACDNVFGAIGLIAVSQVFIELAFMGGYIFSIFDLAPKFASPLTAMMNTFGLIVGLLCPPLVSYMTQNGTREEWLNVFYMSAGINAFGGIFYLLFGSSELQWWAGGDGFGGSGSGTKNGSLGGSGTLRVSTPNVTHPDKELKVLQIRLIGGESDINGEIVKR